MGAGLFHIFKNINTHSKSSYSLRGARRFLKTHTIHTMAWADVTENPSRRDFFMLWPANLEVTHANEGGEANRATRWAFCSGALAALLFTSTCE